MNATPTPHPAPQPTERWSASRVFRTTLAIALAILTALLVTVALSYVVFGGTDRVVLESDGVIDEVSAEAADAVAANTISVRPDPWWMSSKPCDADACTMIAPRTRAA
jgi:hypothetical protein